jgi:hypothetical protein
VHCTAQTLAKPLASQPADTLHMLLLSHLLFDVLHCHDMM